MSTQNTAQEPTMEEILASIRRIISEDTDAEEHVAPVQAVAPAAYAPPPPPPPVAELEDDIGFEEEAEILELTDALPDEPMAEPEPEYLADPEPAPMPAPMPEPAYAPEPQPEPYRAANDLHDLPDDAEEYLPEDEPENEPENEYDDVAFEEPSMTGILSPQTESAAAAAFGALSSSIQTASGGARTLEDLVADMLRPMLKDYLDDKLPELVERLVKEEIERVARRAR